MNSLNYKTLNAYNKIFTQYIFWFRGGELVEYGVKTEWKFFLNFFGFSIEMSLFMSRMGSCALLENPDSPTLEMQLLWPLFGNNWQFYFNDYLIYFFKGYFGNFVCYGYYFLKPCGDSNNNFLTESQSILRACIFGWYTTCI